MQNYHYVRTAEGQAAAYDATSAMPRKLKSLLKVIDGKTSHEVFANSLRAFGDVEGLLISLRKAGLIELNQHGSETSQQTAAPAPASQISAASNSIAPAPIQTSLVSSLASKIRLRSGRTRDASDGFAHTQTTHAPTQAQTMMDSRIHGADRAAERQQDLQLLVQDMSSFVLAYVPEQAFSVLSELESIHSMEQMAVLLGGYELMVRHTGEPASIHLMHVRKIVGKWL